MMQIGRGDGNDQDEDLDGNEKDDQGDGSEDGVMLVMRVMRME